MELGRGIPLQEIKVCHRNIRYMAMTYSGNKMVDRGFVMIQPNKCYFKSGLMIYRCLKIKVVHQN